MLERVSRGPRASRLAEEDWIEAALDMLASGGLAAVRVEPLALRLGVTKGAFYARYATRDALLVAMLDYWRRVAAIDVFTALAAIDEAPPERLERVLNIPTRRADARDRARLEMAIRIWAHQDDRAMAVMNEIDAYRVGHIEAVLKANGFSPVEAEARAFLIYSYVMAEGSLPAGPSDDVKARIRAVLSNKIVPSRMNARDSVAPGSFD